MAVGAICGSAFLGAPLAENLPSDLLKRLFGIVMAAFGLQMLGAFDWIGRLFAR